MQEQEFGLAAHARRNAQDDPFARGASAPGPGAPADDAAAGEEAQDDGEDDDTDEKERLYIAVIAKQGLIRAAAQALS